MGIAFLFPIWYTYSVYLYLKGGGVYMKLREKILFWDAPPLYTATHFCTDFGTGHLSV